MAQDKVLTLTDAKGRARACYPLRTLYGGGWALFTVGDGGEKKLCRKARRHIAYLQWVRDDAAATIAAKQWAASRLDAIEYDITRQLTGELRRATKELELLTRVPQVSDGTPHLHKQVATHLTDSRTMGAEDRAAQRAVARHRSAREDGPVGRARTCEAVERHDAAVKARADAKKRLAHAQEKRAAATKPRYIRYWNSKISEYETALAAL